MSLKEKINNFLNGPTAAIIMTLITIYTLFFDDLRVLCLPKSIDDFFYTLSAAAMATFTFEIIASIYAVEGYLWSFFFWLDVISTVTMIPDIGWLWVLIVKGGAEGGDGGGQATDLAKTARASKVTRILRVVRLARVIRLVKLYKQAKLAQKHRWEKQRAEEQLKIDI